MDRLAQLAIATLLGSATVVLAIWVGEKGLGLVSARRRERLRGWLWIMPAALLVGLFLAWPLVNTVWLSFFNADSSQFVGLENYLQGFSDDNVHLALRNNLLWMLVLVPGTLVFGLMLAVLTDRVRYERLAKSIIFVPMAISFVAGGTIWRFMYDYRPPGSPQTGTVNAVWLALGGDTPQAWLVDTRFNNPAIIIVGVWALTGFALVILSAALKGIPTDLLDAARVDGASEWYVFSRVTLPLVRPTILIVATTMFINAVKIFDIVWVLTGGNFDTDVIATEMYHQLFTARHLGLASTIAVILLLAALPVLIFNIREFRREAAAQ